MQVLIVDDDIKRQADLSLAFMEAGLHTNGTASHAVAESCIRRGWIDVAVMAETVAGRLTHHLALLAEWRNPLLATILLTPRRDEDVEELFTLLPSLHCLLAPDIDRDLITKLLLASVIGSSRAAPPMVLPPEQMVGEPPHAGPIFGTRGAPMGFSAPMRRSA